MLLDLSLVVLGVLFLAVCVLLVLVVLIQEGKAGGLAGTESASSSPGAFSDTFGAGNAQKHLFKTTSILATLFFVLALALTLLGNQKSNQGGSLALDAAPAAAATPAVSVEGDGVVVPAAEAPAAETAVPPSGS
jgi:preprotein translocase subunit SecG